MDPVGEREETVKAVFSGMEAASAPASRPIQAVDA